MRKFAITTCLLLFTIVCVRTVLAQEASQAPPAQAAEGHAHFFHLLYVVQEVGPDGKPTNSRSYTTTVSTDPHDEAASIRTGSRIPVAIGSTSSGENKALENTQYQYFDVGVNIDTHNPREVGRRLALFITADVSSLSGSDERLHQPIIRQNKWRATVLIPLDKPTVIFTSDLLDNKGSMQMVVTATPLQ